MYVDPNFKTKKELQEAVKAGRDVTVFSPGPFPVPKVSIISVEGPQHPEPHRWYARVEVDHTGVEGVVRVKRVVS